MEKIELVKPVTIDGKEIKILEFDLESLTGIDAIEAENEVRALGKTPMVLELEKTYNAAIAAKAMKPKQPIDFILKLSIRDFTAVTAIVQNFLLLDGDINPTATLGKI